MKECSFCGAKNEDWMEICINCGHDLKDAKVPDEKKEEEENRKLSNVGKQDNTNMYLMLVFIILKAL